MTQPLYPWPPPPHAPVVEWRRWRRRCATISADIEAARARRRAELASAVLGYTLIAGWVTALLWAVIAGAPP